MCFSFTRLELRHIDARLSLPYKIHHDKDAIPIEEYVTPLPRTTCHDHPLYYKLQNIIISPSFKASFFAGCGSSAILNTVYIQKGKKKLYTNSMFRENCMILKNISWGSRPLLVPAIAIKKSCLD
jgi:hypothetical protein